MASSRRDYLAAKTDSTRSPRDFGRVTFRLCGTWSEDMLSLPTAPAWPVRTRGDHCCSRGADCHNNDSSEMARTQSPVPCLSSGKSARERAFRRDTACQIHVGGIRPVHRSGLSQNNDDEDRALFGRRRSSSDRAGLGESVRRLQRLAQSSAIVRHSLRTCETRK